jgi:hypothetical protein
MNESSSILYHKHERNRPAISHQLELLFLVLGLFGGSYLLGEKWPSFIFTGRYRPTFYVLRQFPHFCILVVYA